MTEPAAAPPFASPPTHPFYKQLDFWLGFGGWYVINGLVWAAGVKAANSWYDIGANLYILPINVIVLLVTAFARRRFAGGMLTAIALNLLISLLIGATANATCAVPFFIQKLGLILR